MENIANLPQTGYPVKAGKPAVLDVVILTDENSEFGTDGMRDPPNGVRFTEYVGVVVVWPYRGMVVEVVVFGGGPAGFGFGFGLWLCIIG